MKRIRVFISSVQEELFKAIIWRNEAVTETVIDRAIDATKGVKIKIASTLKAIASKEGGNNDDYAKMTNIPVGSMGRYIKQLKDAGWIEFKGGATQTGGYYLIEKMKLLLENNEENRK